MSRKSAKLTFGTKRQFTNSQFALKPGEVRKIIHGATTPRDRCLLRMLADTGMRRAEVAGLDVRDFNLDERRVIIRAGKGDKTRVVPITQELASDLRLLLGRRAPELFAWWSGRLSGLWRGSSTS